MNKESKIKITLSKALLLRDTLTNECKELGRRLERFGERNDLKKLFDQEENLRRVSYALLEANATLGNNERIKGRDILLRKKEVLISVLDKMKKKNSMLSRAVQFIKGKPKVTEIELEKELTYIGENIEKYNTELTNFNSSNTIELTLIGSWKSDFVIVTA